MDLISREALQNEFAHKCRGVCDMCQYDMYGLCNLIKDAPTVETKEVVHGKWIFGKNHGEFVEAECSACNGLLLVKWYDKLSEYNYCPRCGAGMRTSAE
jgi:hypothetical protein